MFSGRGATVFQWLHIGHRGGRRDSMHFRRLQRLQGQRHLRPARGRLVGGRPGGLAGPPLLLHARLDRARLARGDQLRRTAQVGEAAQLKSRRFQSSRMAQGSQSAHTTKQRRQAHHIESSVKRRGGSAKKAARIAYATVNKQDKGGKKSGSGRGKRRSMASSRKGGQRSHKGSGYTKSGGRK